MKHMLTISAIAGMSMLRTKTNRFVHSLQNEPRTSTLGEVRQ